MSNLSELTSLKKYLLNLIVNDRECVDLISLKPSIHLPAKELLNTQIFMYDFVDETVTDAKVFVCLETERVRTQSIVTGEYYLYVTILCHKTLMEINGQIRRDAIAQRIDELFNGNANVKLGKVILYDSRRFKVPGNSYYFARINTYRIQGANLGCDKF